MIIFDTSPLFGLNRRTTKFELLLALKRSGTQKLGIPRIVEEELIAQQVLSYKDAHQNAVTAIAALNRRTPWRDPIDSPISELERAHEYWRNEYAILFEVHETSGDVAKEALVREANCLKPAKVNTKAKGGARDVAVWLSVIDYLKANPEENVYFVSENVNDFGDGTDYPSPMSEDLGDMQSRMTHLTSFDDVIDRFTATIAVDLEHVKEVLDGIIAQAAATTEAQTDAVREEWLTTLQYEPFQWQSWLLPPVASVRSVNNAVGHRIAEEEWYVAEVTWVLAGVAQSQPGQRAEVPFLGERHFRDIALVLTACEWTTKVLLSTRPGEVPALLDFELPAALDLDADADLGSLIDSAIASPSEVGVAVGATFVALRNALLAKARRDSRASLPATVRQLA